MKLEPALSYSVNEESGYPLVFNHWIRTLPNRVHHNTSLDEREGFIIFKMIEAHEESLYDDLIDECIDRFSDLISFTMDVSMHRKYDELKAEFPRAQFSYLVDSV